MKWRYALVVVLLLSLAAARAAVGVFAAPVPSVTYTGQVDIAMGPDGRLLVLVDEGTASKPGDGLVEQAFRVQGAPSLAYSGTAMVTQTRGRLAVHIGADAGWVFNIAGRDLPPPDLALTAYTVSGISHLSGDAIHQSPATLFSTLSSGSCSPVGAQPTSTFAGTIALADGDLDCRNCQAGGPGLQSCSINCGGGSSCDADCDADSFACCSCPFACGCCSTKEGIGAHH